MRLFPAPVLLALAAAVVLAALIAASSRLGLPDSLALGLLIPIAAGAIAIAIGAGATMRGGVFSLGTGAAGADALPLLAATGATAGLCALTGVPLMDIAGYLPALAIGLILHGLLSPRNPRKQPLIAARMPEAPARWARIALLAVESLLLAGTCLLLADLAARAGAAMTGAQAGDVTALLCGLAIAAVIAGGRSASFSLAGLMIFASIAALGAIFLGYAAAHGWRLLPLFAEPEIAAAMDRLHAEWFGGGDASAAAYPISGQVMTGAAICGFLYLLRSSDAVSAPDGRALSTTNSLILVALLALLMGAMPFNMTRSLGESLIGYDPNALPLWVTDGRFAGLLQLCGTPAEPAATQYCSTTGAAGMLSPSDVRFREGNELLIAALASGLHRPVALAAALALLSILAAGLLLLFSRLCLLLFSELPTLARTQPVTTSARLALARLGALLTGATLAAASGEPALTDAALALLPVLLPAFALPAMLAERLDAGNAGRMAMAAFAGAAMAAACLASGIPPLHAGAWGAGAGITLLAVLGAIRRLRRLPSSVQA